MAGIRSTAKGRDEFKLEVRGPDGKIKETREAHRPAEIEALRKKNENPPEGEGEDHATE